VLSIQVHFYENVNQREVQLITTVFFDLGNTIVDYHTGKLTDEEKDFIGLWRMHCKLKTAGIEILFEELVNTFYYPWVGTFSERNKRKTEVNMLDYMPEKIRNRGDSIDFILEFHEPTARCAISIDGIENALRELKSRNITLGIISNSPIPGECHDMTLKLLHLFDYFSYRLYSYDIGMRKPGHDIFKHALHVSGTSAGNCMMIGDRYELDITPAQEIGMNALWYTGNKTPYSRNDHNVAISQIDEIVKRMDI
jgi:HAD superfamily hydrolase (TIGR01509 family)